MVYFHETDYYRIILSLYLQLLEKFFKIGVLKNFSQFTGKQLCQSFFIKCKYMYVKSKLRELENLFSFFTSDSVNLLLSVINSFIAEVPITKRPVH